MRKARFGGPFAFVRCDTVYLPLLILDSFSTEQVQMTAVLKPVANENGKESGEFSAGAAAAYTKALVAS